MAGDGKGSVEDGSSVKVLGDDIQVGRLVSAPVWELKLGGHVHNYEGAGRFLP